jgi:uridine phosphorylase
MQDKKFPIGEYYGDQMKNLDMFFGNGKKEFWRFDRVKELGIDSCVMFFPRDFAKLENIFCKCELIYEFKSASSISPVYLYDKKVLIALSPLGGPAAANLMEELIYVGIKKIIGVGSCGAITNVDFDDYFVPNSAIRDEGVSYHYLPASRFIETDKGLTQNIIDVLVKHSEAFLTGTVWSTDAIYRETPERISARLKDGAIGVEMETASLCAVAQAKNIRYSCLLYFSDYNNGKLWNTRIYDKFALREELIKLAIEAVLLGK